MTDPLTWLWLEVVRPGWISLLAAPFVLTGYGASSGERAGGSSWPPRPGCLAIGLTDRQYGLVVVLVLIWQGVPELATLGPGTGGRGMNGDVVRGALWANDLTRLRQPEPSRGQYAMVEVRYSRTVTQLAQAMDVDEPVVRERLELVGRGDGELAVGQHRPPRATRSRASMLFWSS